jgi:hypothetical protein
VNGTQYTAELVGFFMLGGVAHVVVCTPDGTMAAHSVTEIASIQFSPAHTSPAAPTAPTGPTAPAVPAAPATPSAPAGLAASGSTGAQQGTPPTASTPPATSPPSAAPQPQPKYYRVEVEPNNDAVTANPIQIGFDVTAAIATSGDYDVFSFVAPGQGLVKITCTQPTDLYMSLVDSAGRQLSGGDFGSFGTTMKLETELPAAGIYYILVRGYSSAYWSSSPYTLRAEFAQITPDALEPNDTIAQATAIESGRQIQSFIYKPGDLDYFRLAVPGASTIHIVCTQPADYYLTMFDSTGARRLAGGDFGGAGNDIAVSADVFQPGNYYIQVRGASSDDYSAQTPYRLTASVRAAGTDQNEPNDKPEQARLLQLGQSVEGFISSGSDQDWWTFDAPFLGKLKISCTQPGDYTMRVLDSAGKEVFEHDQGGVGMNIEAVLQLPPLARYYVVIQAATADNYNMHEPYHLTLMPTF